MSYLRLVKMVWEGVSVSYLRLVKMVFLGGLCLC